MPPRRDWTERVGRRIRLRDLHVLLAVAQAGSMGKAAGTLAVSQPVISKAIADLEQALGVRLLDRSAHGVELTRYGREVIKCGIAVFDELRGGIKALEMLSDPGSGELRIGCTEPLAAGFVGTLIGQLSHQHPRASIEVVTADPTALNERELRRRNVELVVSPVDGISVDAETQLELLFDDRQVIMAAAHSKWVRRRRLTLSDLESERWFMPPLDSAIGAHITECFRAAGLEPPRPHVSSFSIPLCLRMVERENFLAMLPLSMLRHGEHLQIRPLRVATPHIPRPTGILTIKNRTLGPLADLFIAMAREHRAAIAERPSALARS